MKRAFCIFICLLLLMQACLRNKEDPNRIYFKDFDWSIVLPGGFTRVSPEDWRPEAFGNALEKKESEHPRVLLVFKKDEYNFFEVNCQSFDEKLDGDYLGSWQAEINRVYQSLNNETAIVKIDTLSSTEEIGGFQFQKFYFKAYYPEMDLSGYLYKCLLGKRIFSAIIMFRDESSGEQLLSAWKRSSFGKKITLAMLLYRD